MRKPAKRRDGKTDRRDAAFTSGAQIVATDFLVPDKKIGAYQVALAKGHAQCDARLPGMQCAAWAARPPRVVTAHGNPAAIIFRSRSMTARASARQGLISQ